MTQAPTPGPLLQGDIVRGPNGQTETVKTANPDFVVMVSGNGYLPSLVTFIGRSDAEGWIPWSGGENPVPGQMVDYRTKGGQEVLGVDGSLACWGPSPGSPHKQVSRFRLAPTAPVEASGSEREIASEAEGEPLASIAESLKRIADLLDGTTAGICVTETLLGGRRIDQ